MNEAALSALLDGKHVGVLAASHVSLTSLFERLLSHCTGYWDLPGMSHVWPTIAAAMSAQVLVADA